MPDFVNVYFEIRSSHLIEDVEQSTKECKNLLKNGFFYSFSCFDLSKADWMASGVICEAEVTPRVLSLGRVT